MKFGEFRSFDSTAITPSMTSPEKKTITKKKPSPESTQIASLPDDLLLRCFARISRLHYPTLSLVSKSFRSLLASPELYKTRSLLNRTESCLYVCLKFPPDLKPRWFTLWLIPNRTIIKDNEKNQEKKKKLGGKYVLAKIPILSSPPAHCSGLVALGSNIYNIGGCTDKSPSSTVSFLDCWSHTWKLAPNMLMKRNYPAANVVDGKIYVAGGCKGCDSSNWMEVFDPKAQSWDLVSCPMKALCGCDIGISAGMNGKVYTLTNCNASGKCKGLAYETRKGTWIEAVWEMDIGSYTVIENVLYYYSKGVFKWVDIENRRGGELRGLEGLPKFASYACVKLSDYGGKMAVLWDEFVPSSGYKDKMIWCAVIAFEMRDNKEMWGKVEWYDAVLTVPESYEFEYALSVTV